MRSGDYFNRLSTFYFFVQRRLRIIIFLTAVEIFKMITDFRGFLFRAASVEDHYFSNSRSRSG